VPGIRLLREWRGSRDQGLIVSFPVWRSLSVVSQPPKIPDQLVLERTTLRPGHFSASARTAIASDFYVRAGQTVAILQQLRSVVLPGTPSNLFTQQGLQSEFNKNSPPE
jgi:hypothetical protein